MKQYKEIRKIRAGALRQLCIDMDWYTAGDNDEYTHLLHDLAGNKENLSTADIIEIAADIMDQREFWEDACLAAETAYFNMLDCGCSPQEARSVLPNSLKTEVIMTANIREWRHFLKLRCDTAAHPQMRELALKLLKMTHEAIPVLFDDIWKVYGDEQ